jgi:UTP--glucose-1-phosphate uridylyltransferase
VGLDGPLTRKDASVRTDDAIAKLEADGAPGPVLAAFRRRLEQLADPGAGLLPGAALEPIEDPPALEDLGDVGAGLEGLAVIKLNGGLGTSMGLRGPKALIEVKTGRTFLDVIVAQSRALDVPLVLMSSFATRDATREALRDTEVHDFLQSREPKLDAETLEPIAWPADPALEWCPPGHGDLYVSLAASGTLQWLLDEGRDWAFVSNGDNLGAVADPRILAWARRERVPFVMEVVRGTDADRKGGHLARRDGRLVLRETAQAPGDDPSFTDVDRWRWYNTNNLWVDLKALQRLLAADEAGPELPLIVNRKTVDPSDPSSPAVLQLETAMGAAIGAIEGARAVAVPRSRFAPVKTTDDLLVVRSDAYSLTDDGRMQPAFAGEPPVVALDPEYYKLLPEAERRFPAGPPSLRRCRRLTVHGDVTFGAGVVVEGEVELHGPARIADGEVLRG